MLKDKLKAIKKDSETIKKTFKGHFSAFQLASSFNLDADHTTNLLASVKAYGFLKEHGKGKMEIVLHPDQRSLNLDKNIKTMEDQLKQFENAVIEAKEIRSLTFEEKLQP